MKRLTIIFMLILTAKITAQIDFVQQVSGSVDPKSLVTISETLPFSKAIDILSLVSEKLTGKKIVSTVKLEVPIGVTIDKIPYKKALLIIVQYHNLVFEEGENTIVVKKKTEAGGGDTSSTSANINDREVSISALFFEGDVYSMRERGVNWQWLLTTKGLSIGPSLTTAQSSITTSGSSTTTTTPTFDLTTNSAFNMAGFDGTATSMLRFFENENLGELFSSPTVTVKSGRTARLQVGVDISIKQKDFAGNMQDKFVPTGTILTVTPRIMTEDGIDFVYLQLEVEKSTGTVDVTTTTIAKTYAKTMLLLLDGEETTIGGLYVNEESDVRRGIPILKDLPWWVFGIRYLTGYDAKTINKKEIIITVKVNILPTLRDRIKNKIEENLIKKEQLKNQKLMDKYKSDSAMKEELNK